MRETAMALGVAVSTVHADLARADAAAQRAMAERLADREEEFRATDRRIVLTVTEMRAAETAKLDRMEERAEAIAADPDVGAAGVLVAQKFLLSLSERRAKLHRLDAPPLDENGENGAALLELLPDAVPEVVTHLITVALAGALHSVEDYEWKNALQSYGAQYFVWVMDGRPEPRPVCPPRPAPAPQAPAPERVAVAELMPGPGWSSDEQRLVARALAILDADVIDDDQEDAV
jgi:hypothetical protein